MKKTARFVIWICSKFTHQEIEEIIQGLLDVLANRNPEVKPKDDFQEKHPRHRSKAKYFCPHCSYSLYLWKERRDVSIYKCDNDRCPSFLKNKANLNFRERILAKIKSS